MLRLKHENKFVNSMTCTAQYSIMECTKIHPVEDVLTLACNNSCPWLDPYFNQSAKVDTN